MTARNPASPDWAALPSPSATIDSMEFNDLMAEYCNMLIKASEPTSFDMYDKRVSAAYVALIAHIDARLAAAAEQANRDGWQEGMQEAQSLLADDDSSVVLAKLESDIANTLPSTYYMDPPDGGSVTLGEQVRRMAADAARYRWLRDSGEKPAVFLNGNWYGSKYRICLHLDAAIDAAMSQDQKG